jgi:hypothetical protein
MVGTTTLAEVVSGPLVGDGGSDDDGGGRVGAVVDGLVVVREAGESREWVVVLWGVSGASEP